VQGTEKQAFKMFLELQKQNGPKRTLFLFLTSSDLKIRGEDYETRHPSATTYDTKPLTPSGAVEYLRSRLALLRPDQPPAWLTSYPLFPFTEEIIYRCLSPASKALWATQSGSVDIPGFNVRFSKALEAAFRQFPEGL